MHFLFSENQEMDKPLLFFCKIQWDPYKNDKNLAKCVNLHNSLSSPQDLRLLLPRCNLLYSQGKTDDYIDCAIDVLFGYFRDIFKKSHLAGNKFLMCRLLQASRPRDRWLEASRPRDRLLEASSPRDRLLEASTQSTKG